MVKRVPITVEKIKSKTVSLFGIQYRWNCLNYLQILTFLLWLNLDLFLDFNFFRKSSRALTTLVLEKSFKLLPDLSRIYNLVLGQGKVLLLQVDEKQTCLGFFLDLAKSFGTVSIPALVIKLECCKQVFAETHLWFWKTF